MTIIGSEEVAQYYDTCTTLPQVHADVERLTPAEARRTLTFLLGYDAEILATAITHAKGGRV